MTTFPTIVDQPGLCLTTLQNYGFYRSNDYPMTGSADGLYVYSPSGSGIDRIRVSDANYEVSWCATPSIGCCVGSDTNIYSINVDHDIVQIDPATGLEIANPWATVPAGNLGSICAASGYVAAVSIGSTSSVLPQYVYAVSIGAPGSVFGVGTPTDGTDHVYGTTFGAINQAIAIDHWLRVWLTLARPPAALGPGTFLADIFGGSLGFEPIQPLVDSVNDPLNEALGGVWSWQGGTALLLGMATRPPGLKESWFLQLELGSPVL